MIMARDAVADADPLGKLAARVPAAGSVRAEVARRFVPASYPFGAVIACARAIPPTRSTSWSAGEPASSSAGTPARTVPLNVLRAGDAFGEMALLEQTTRMATVRASSDVEALRPRPLGLRGAAGGRAGSQEVPELQAAHRRLHNFFALLHRASPACRRTRWLTMLAELGVGGGGGRASWSSARAIRRGRCTSSRKGACGCSWRDDGERRYIRYLRRGDFFGELSLFQARGARSTTVEAVAPRRLLRLTERPSPVC